MTQNDNTNEDPRVKRTHKLLQEALIEMTVLKGFAAVTVSDITRHAGVNRATFYRHYQDKIDLLNQYAQTVYDLLEALPETRSPQPSEGKASQTYLGLIAIFEHIRANARFYRVMLGKNGDPMFVEKIRQYIQKRIWRSLPRELQKYDNAVDLYLSSSSSASMGAVLWWLEHDMPHSVKEIATISYQTGENLSAILGQAPPYEDWR